LFYKKSSFTLISSFKQRIGDKVEEEKGFYLDLKDKVLLTCFLEHVHSKKLFLVSVVHMISGVKRVEEREKQNL
jgi:hypothetical protein